MAIVYKYTDVEDNTIKYIGIIYSENRTLQDRINEHSKEERFQDKTWKIEYFECGNRSVAEAWESHLISKYNTDKYLNVSKNNWGINPYMPIDNNLWTEYKVTTEKYNKYELDSIFTKFNDIWYMDVKSFNNKKLLDNYNIIMQPNKDCLRFVGILSDPLKEKYKFFYSDTIPKRELQRVDDGFIIKNIECKDIFENSQNLTEAYECCFAKKITPEIILNEELLNLDN